MSGFRDAQTTLPYLTTGGAEIKSPSIEAEHYRSFEDGAQYGMSEYSPAIG
jgi:hypothetical protein